MALHSAQHTFVGGIDTLDALAKELLAQSSNIRLWHLHGPLGAGKTTTIQALCKALGSSSRITSPSFGIVHTYTDATSQPIYHIDAYRLSDLDPAYLQSLQPELQEYIEEGHYCFIEWPSRLDIAWEHYAYVTLHITPQYTSSLRQVEHSIHLPPN